jgi:hypothetical protein
VSFTAGSAPATHEGQWLNATIGYLKQHSLHCELCGQLLPGRYLRDAVGRAFCGLRHEALYHSYWLPRYGSS